MTPEQAAIMDRMLSEDFYLSPYKFAMWAYDWGNGDLQHFPDGPRKWQKEIMLEIEAYLKEAIQLRSTLGFLPDFFRLAVASGRGPGKSALIGMLSHWFKSTRIGGSGWVAANGEPQLRTKTFPEIAKWVARGINAEFFEINATSIVPAKWFKEFIESSQGLAKSTKYYYISGQLWSAENPDAFAGAHNFDGELAIFDEASGIPDSIWTVQEGVFTENTPDRFWLAFSNPRQNQGAFFECFHKNRNLWRTKQIDSRTVEGISTTTFDNIIAKFGADSDEARVEVYGQFPNIGDNQFISRVVVDDAIAREPYKDDDAPIVIGVDVARFGTDRTCIVVRQGRDIVTIKRFSKLDTMQVVGHVILAIEKYKPALVCIDEGGLGAGVVDRLKEQRYKVRGVNFGYKSSKKEYFNKRTEMWGEMREWLLTASMPDDSELKDDLLGPRYKVNSTGQVQLESKDDMKKRGIASPDAADAVALTFAHPVSQHMLRRKVDMSDEDEGVWARPASSGHWMAC